VFVGSGIFMSENPRERAAAIVQAVTHFTEPKKLAAVSRGLGRGMIGSDPAKQAVTLKN
jgi:pyridoxal 5'-phosphate synthase pdxS subunit